MKTSFCFSKLIYIKLFNEILFNEIEKALQENWNTSILLEWSATLK